MGKTNFWNRKKELQQIRDTLNPFLYISSPPFFGKTCLLQKLQEERREQGWKRECFSIKEFLSLKNSNRDDVLNYISERLGVENYVKLKVCVNKGDKLLIIIDDLHILADKSNENIEKLKSIFLEVFEAYKQLKPKEDNFQLILAGRYINSETFKRKVQFHGRGLNNPQLIELLAFKAEDVLLIIENYLRDAEILESTGDTQRQQWSKDIRYLSCGHPEAILNLVEHLVSESKKRVLEASYVKDDALKLFNEFVQPLLTKVLKELPNSIYDTLKILSIFEKFNPSTLNFLRQKSLIKVSNHAEVLETFGILGIICAEDSDNFYYLDAILTEMLKRSIELTDTSLYQSLHENAIEFYSQKESSKDITFYLYYSLLLKKENDIVISLEKLLKYFKDMNHGIEKLKNHLDLDGNLNKLFEEKPELETLLNKCLQHIEKGNQSSNV